LRWAQVAYEGACRPHGLENGAYDALSHVGVRGDEDCRRYLWQSAHQCVERVLNAVCLAGIKQRVVMLRPVTVALLKPAQPCLLISG